MSKNRAAVALGKLAAKKRTKEQLAAAGRLGGLAKAAARNGTGSTPSALADPGTTPVKNGPTKKRK